MVIFSFSHEMRNSKPHPPPTNWKSCSPGLPHGLEGASLPTVHLPGSQEGIRKGLGLLQLLSVEARLAHSSEFSNDIQKTEFHRQHHLLQVSPQRC